MNNQKYELLKEWNEAIFDQYTKKIICKLQNALYNKVFNFTAGEQPRESCNSWTVEKVENLFGLPYVSSGDFAALWNTNTQAEAIFNDIKYYFRGVAISTASEVIFVLDDYNENYIYINEKELNQMSKAQALTDYAREIDKAQEVADKIAQEVTDLLKRYAGKRYGEKTKVAIYEEIREKTNKYGEGFRVLLDGGHFQTLNIDKYIQNKSHGGYKYFNVSGFEWLDNQTNTIKAPQFTPKQRNKTAEQASKENKKLIAKIEKLAGELLPIIEQYNANNNIMQKEDRETFNNQSINIYVLSKYGVEL